MAYDPIILRRASQRLSAERREREERQERLKAKLFQQIPELSDIDRQLRGTVLDVIEQSLRNGSDPTPALQVLRDKNMTLQERQAELLRSAGYPADVLDNSPVCKLCGDTGWTKDGMCTCLQALCVEEQLKELSKSLNLREQSFDTFSLDWYSSLPWAGEAMSPRANMEFLCELCMNYAQKFGKFLFKNLFLSGNTGLGKTFLSACIAKVVAENGFSVVYDTAVNVFAKFEEQKFGKNVQDNGELQEETRRYLNCDLLILDDLGSEMTTAFTQSALYHLVNTRLTANKATVISSNLTMDGVRERYNGQTASRLEGEYRVLRFYGEDIRLMRKARL